MNFSDFTDYLRTEKRASAHTVEAYGRDLAQFGTWCAAQYEISEPGEVSTSVVRSWMASLMEDEYASRSVHRKLSSVNSWYRFLMRRELTGKNPARGLIKPKIPKRLPQFLEEKSADKIYDEPQAETEPRVALMVRLLYETGIRVSELCGLEVRDLDPSLSQIKVTGKRNKIRYVPVSTELMNALFALVKEEQNSGEDLNLKVFQPAGKKLNRNLVYREVRSYLSGITTLQKKSPHILRHTFATHMLNNGADLNVIKEILGHSSLAATQVYTHNSIQKLKNIHSKLHPRNKKSNP